MIASSPTTASWLSRRVRLLCVAIFVFGALLPPYIPSAALAPTDITVSQQINMVEDGFLMKSSSITQQGARRAYAQGVIHTVQDGESLEKIASRYGISVKTIQWANKATEGTPIRPGDELVILPVDGVLHQVSRGQTLLGIAELYNIDVQTIMTQNAIKTGFILAGQELIIPGGQPIVAKPTVVATVEQPVKLPSGDTPVPTKPPAQPSTKPVVPVSPPANVQATTTLGVLQKPCSDKCFYTQYYRAGHYAVDMQERGGGPIFAAEAGTVIRSDYGWQGGYGNVIEIDHGNGLVSLYGHLKDIYVEVGDEIARGQNIASMGNTGLVYGPTGIHLHFEVRLNGEKKNPVLYLE